MEPFFVHQNMPNVQGFHVTVLWLNFLLDLKLISSGVQLVDNDWNFQHLSHSTDFYMIRPFVVLNASQQVLPTLGDKLLVQFGIAFKVFPQFLPESGHIPAIFGLIESQNTVIETAAVFKNILHFPTLLLGSQFHVLHVLIAIFFFNNVILLQLNIKIFFKIPSIFKIFKRSEISGLHYTSLSLSLSFLIKSSYKSQNTQTTLPVTTCKCK